MRLLDTKTYQLRQFNGRDIPPYAILSHRWAADEEEVSFQDLQLGKVKRRRIGWSKIKHCCELTAKRGLDYVWIDTCCIDKSSSAELQEAINSMFKWYKNSEICYVHMRDVKKDQPNLKKAFEASDWFTRCWTLQELLAPSNIEFRDGDWTYLGSVDNWVASISTATSIDMHIVHLYRGLEQFSVAQKMSWASKREASREEDIAYSLMGIFDVNMPLIYGEGVKAFMRLQYEILNQSNDESIFAWFRDGSLSGMLASSPADFKASRDILSWTRHYRQHYSMTNQGLHIPLRLQPHYPAGKSGPQFWNTPLNCVRFEGERLTWFTIFLAKSTTNVLNSRSPHDEWLRIGPLGEDSYSNHWSAIEENYKDNWKATEEKHVYVRQKPPSDVSQFSGFHKGYQFRTVVSDGPTRSSKWNIDYEALNKNLPVAEVKFI